MNYRDATVLVVDDEELIVEQLVFYLSELGFKVTGYTNPVEAREALAQKNFDIFITDLKMPEISGMELVKIISDKQIDTKIIILTGFATTDSAIDAIKYGVYRYIRKPFELGEVGEIVINAAKMLYLERENAALNKQIQRMYHYMTTLYEVTSILYQVSDLDLAIDMSLDTVIEALKTESVGIFLGSLNSRYFELQYHKGSRTEFLKSLKFSSESIINGQKIGTKKGLIIEPEDGNLKVNGLSPLTDIANFAFIPINYHEKLLGFMVVLNIQKNEFELEEKFKLLEILSTQLAPVIYSRFMTRAMETDIKPLNQIIEDLIDKKIFDLQKSHTSMAIANLQLVPNVKSTHEGYITKIKTNIRQIIGETIESDIEVIWQSHDSLVLLKPGANVVDLEIIASIIKQKIEQLTIDEKINEPAFKLIYAIGVYPFDGQNAGTLLNEIAHRLIEQYKSLSKE
ncbi:MAG: response regulator [Candidatus Jordarchaeaceae archaeon]